MATEQSSLTNKKIEEGKQLLIDELGSKKAAKKHVKGVKKRILKKLEKSCE